MVDPATVGLTRRGAQARLTVNGPNALPSPHPVSLLTRIITALREPLVLVLLAAMALTILSRDAQTPRSSLWSSWSTPRSRSARRCARNVTLARSPGWCR